MDFGGLPKPIVDHIVEVVEREYEYSDDRIYATEPCSCILRAYLKRRYPMEKSMQRLWVLYRGLVFDELWTKRFDRNQVRVTYRVKGGPTIVGKRDFIYNNTLYELKTVSTVKRVDRPYEHHIKQVRFYAYCENMKRAKIIYVSFDGFKIFDINCSDDVTLPVVEEFETKAIELYNALKNNIPPPPDGCEDWECKYCEYLGTYCGGSEVGFISEPIPEMNKLKS